MLLVDAAGARLRAGEVEVVHGRLEAGGGVLRDSVGQSADGYGGVEGGLGRDAREEVGEGLGGDDGGIAEVFELGLDGADGAVDLGLLHLLEGRHDD